MGVRIGVICHVINAAPVILSFIISWGNAMWLCSPDILSSDFQEFPWQSGVSSHSRWIAMAVVVAELIIHVLVLCTELQLAFHCQQNINTHLLAGCPFCCPANGVKSLRTKWKCIWPSENWRLYVGGYCVKFDSSTTNGLSLHGDRHCKCPAVAWPLCAVNL